MSAQAKSIAAPPPIRRFASAIIPSDMSIASVTANDGLILRAQLAYATPYLKQSFGPRGQVLRYPRLDEATANAFGSERCDVVELGTNLVRRGEGRHSENLTS